MLKPLILTSNIVKIILDRAVLKYNRDNSTLHVDLVDNFISNINWDRNNISLEYPEFIIHLKENFSFEKIINILIHLLFLGVFKLLLAFMFLLAKVLDIDKKLSKCIIENIDIIIKANIDFLPLESLKDEKILDRLLQIILILREYYT